MNVVLYMATTVNGYIAKKDGETSWSDEEWKSFSAMVERSGNLVIGRKTFEVMTTNDEFRKLGNPYVLVVSHIAKQQANFVLSPEDAIALLKEKGFSTVLVGGGSELNSSFMRKGLIDEIYVDIEPFLFGTGIKLFAEDTFERQLRLLDSKKLSEHTLQLHYEIIK